MRKYILIILILFSLSTFFICKEIYSTERVDHECIKCHQITNEEATNLLKEIIPDIRILEIRNAAIKGLWEVSVERGGQKGVVYIDFSKNLLISGSILNVKTKTNLTQERLLEINKVDISKIPLDDALVMGEKDAKHRVIVFTDPDCPFCSKLHQEMKKVIEKRKDIAFYIKMFPLPMHKGAYEKAKAIVCEKSLALLDDAFAKKELPKATCETKVLDENLKLGESVGISGTPAIIMPNGTLVPGFKEADALIALIDKFS
ncbi:MAG: DsbC family protein [Nitrospirae bacterium]|nr:DsbC family protein [Nitrospirota bacterium]